MVDTRSRSEVAVRYDVTPVDLVDGRARSEIVRLNYISGRNTWPSRTMQQIGFFAELVTDVGRLPLASGSDLRYSPQFTDIVSVSATLVREQIPDVLIGHLLVGNLHAANKNGALFYGNELVRLKEAYTYLGYVAVRPEVGTVIQNHLKALNIIDVMVLLGGAGRPLAQPVMTHLWEGENVTEAVLTTMGLKRQVDHHRQIPGFGTGELVIVQPWAAPAQEVEDGLMAKGVGIHESILYGPQEVNDTLTIFSGPLNVPHTLDI